MNEDTNSTKQPKAESELSAIQKMLHFIHDRDARLGLALSVFVLLLLTFVWFSNAYGNISEGGFYGIFRSFLGFLFSAAGFVIFFKVIDGSVLPRYWFGISPRC